MGVAVRVELATVGVAIMRAPVVLKLAEILLVVLLPGVMVLLAMALLVMALLILLLSAE